jgi:hypothetical protein
LVSQHIITELLNDGILALDIHDSFIVQREYEERERSLREGVEVDEPTVGRLEELGKELGIPFEV